MEHRKVLDLLNKPNDSKFVTRKWNMQEIKLFIIHKLIKI